MSTAFIPPIQQIGEPGWVAKLPAYLESYGIRSQRKNLAAIQQTEESLNFRK